MATVDQRKEIKACIRYYERMGWDWSSVVEYLCSKYNGSIEAMKDYIVIPKRGKRVRQ